MSALRKELTQRFSQKVYPNLNDPKIKEAMEAGRREFEKKYLGQAYPWSIDGLLSRFDTHYYTFSPNHENLTIGIFPAFVLNSLDNPDRDFIMPLLGRVREAGFNFFESTPWQKRVKLLLEISKVVEERFWLLVAAKQYETGQSLMEAIGETDETVDFPLAKALYLLELHENEHLLPSPSWAGDYNGFRWVPHGVFLNICPFNFPDAIPMDMACNALAMGNAIIEKSSDKSSVCGYLVYESLKIAFNRLGIAHKGVINYAPGGPEVVDYLLESPDIAGVSFTGSSSALAEIKKKHGSMLRNTYAGGAPLAIGSAETSGINPVVVWNDVDVEYAAKECVRSVIGRQGQKCSSARVIMVHKDIRDVFVGHMIRSFQTLKFGNVLEGADFGEVITSRAGLVIRETIKHLMETRIVVSEVNPHPAPGFCREGSLPAILIVADEIWNDKQKARELMNTEIFGPATTVISVSGLETICLLRSLSDFALTGSYFAEDPDICIELNKILKTGNLYQNRKCTGALVDTECFGGMRSRSGDGAKHKKALMSFGSMQTHSGFYGRSWNDTQKKRFIERMEEEQGVVFSKK